MVENNRFSTSTSCFTFAHVIRNAGYGCFFCAHIYKTELRRAAEGVFDIICAHLSLMLSSLAKNSER